LALQTYGVAHELLQPHPQKTLTLVRFFCVTALIFQIW
jgi:hypothetical protein